MASWEVASVAPKRRPPVGSPQVTAVPPAAAATIAAETLIAGGSVFLQPVAVGARGRVA